jgi:predicted RNase H-like nuclease (RuvC/YqgF family)
MTKLTEIANQYTNLIKKCNELFAKNSNIENMGDAEIDLFIEEIEQLNKNISDTAAKYKELKDKI